MNTVVVLGCLFAIYLLCVIILVAILGRNKALKTRITNLRTRQYIGWPMVIFAPITLVVGFVVTIVMGFFLPLVKTLVESIQCMIHAVAEYIGLAE